MVIVATLVLELVAVVATVAVVRAVAVVSGDDLLGGRVVGVEIVPDGVEGPVEGTDA